LARIAKKITLTPKQEKILLSLSNGRTVPAHFQQRALILLHCSEGKTNLDIMGELGVHKKTISKWRTRWAENAEKLFAIENEEKGITYQRSIEGVLNDAPRSGTPCKFTAEQICLIMNVACESPEENGLPLSHWSLSSLADELVKREIIDSISTSQLQVFLKSGQYQTAQSETVDSYSHRR
jgi:transposase